MKREASICEQRPGFCCGDARCPDHLCPGHPHMEGVPFYQADGGHTFNRGLVFPIAQESDEEADAPLYTPESAAAPVPPAMQLLLGAVVAVCLVIASGAIDQLIPHLNP